jgi:hypothetical protein
MDEEKIMTATQCVPSTATTDENDGRTASMNDVPKIDGDGDVLGEVDAEQSAALVPGREDDVAARGLDRRGANLAAALWLVRAGMPVFPVRLFQGSRGEWRKLPAIKDWQRVAIRAARQSTAERRATFRKCARFLICSYRRVGNYRARSAATVQGNRRWPSQMTLNFAIIDL